MQRIGKVDAVVRGDIVASVVCMYLVTSLPTEECMLQRCNMIRIPHSKYVNLTNYQI